MELADLKAVLHIQRGVPPLPADWLELVVFVARYYHAPLGEGGRARAASGLSSDGVSDGTRIRCWALPRGRRALCARADGQAGRGGWAGTRRGAGPWRRSVIPRPGQWRGGGRTVAPRLAGDVPDPGASRRAGAAAGHARTGRRSRDAIVGAGRFPAVAAAYTSPAAADRVLSAPRRVLAQAGRQVLMLRLEISAHAAARAAHWQRFAAANVVMHSRARRRCALARLRCGRSAVGPTSCSAPASPCSCAAAAGWDHPGRQGDASTQTAGGCAIRRY